MSQTPTPAFEIVSLTRRITESNGRHYWAAEVKAGTGRAGADSRFGSWSCYELPEDGAPLSEEHGLPGVARRAVLTDVAAGLAAAVTRKEASPADGHEAVKQYSVRRSAH